MDDELGKRAEKIVMAATDGQRRAGPLATNVAQQAWGPAVLDEMHREFHAAMTKRVWRGLNG